MLTILILCLSNRCFGFYKKNINNLFKLLDTVVEEVGEENVAQVITDNASNYKVAGKLLVEKIRNLFWTPC